MIHLRLTVPPEVTDTVVARLRSDDRVVHLLLLRGAGVDPPGDAILCDVAREAASRVIDDLHELGVDGGSGIAIEEVDATASPAAERAEQVAPGAPDDAIVWDLVVSRARRDTQSSWSFYAFLCLATLIASVAVVTDSSVLVVGAMVVGPEFGPVAALAVAVVLGQWRLGRDALKLTVLGFLAAIAVTTVLGLAARGAGWVDAADILAPRPLTGFIWKPDRWSVVVALLAGAAGVLSLTAGRANALVGVFISVTTVPAAGNLALAIALGVPEEMGGALAQLLLNLGCMTVAGALMISVQRVVTGDLRAPGVLARRGRGRRPRPGPDPRAVPRP